MIRYILNRYKNFFTKDLNSFTDSSTYGELILFIVFMNIVAAMFTLFFILLSFVLGWVFTSVLYFLVFNMFVFWKELEEFGRTPLKKKETESDKFRKETL